MKSFYGGPYSRGDGELSSLVAAGLICGFRGSSPGEIYEKAVKCFDILMDIMEDSATARKISSIAGITAAAAKDSVQSIIDLLLFNSGNDPHMSLCLPRHARHEEISRRWKRLIVFYHPDKYSGQHSEFEERAKRINEAYEVIQKAGKGLHMDEAVRSVFEKNAEYTSLGGKAAGYMRKRKTSLRKHMRRMPLFIVVFSLFVTVISILLFIYVV